MDDTYKGLRYFKKISDFKYEFDNYGALTENYLSYYFLSVEEDARDAAALGVEEYYYHIDKYWDAQMQQE